MTIRFAAAIAALLLTTQAAPVAAANLKGIEFPDTITVEGKELRLNGIGVRSKFFVSVYLGALYLPTPAGDPAAIISSEETKRVVMHFLHSKVSGSQFRDALTEGFTANSADRLPALRERLDRFLGWFDADMVTGDVITFTWLPGRGVEVVIKGSPKGVIEGADFMQALFSVWLGRSPADSGLKKGMLGGK
jgi:hypothetical protein